jgi:hypothetical protein
MKTKAMKLLREIATGLVVVVATLVVLYVAVGAACLILGLCMYLSSDLFANYFGPYCGLDSGRPRVSGYVRVVESVGLVGRTAKFMIPVTSRESSITLREATNRSRHTSMDQRLKKACFLYVDPKSDVAQGPMLSQASVGRTLAKCYTRKFHVYHGYLMARFCPMSPGPSLRR